MPFRLDSVFFRLAGCLTLLAGTAWAQQQAGYRIDTIVGLQGVRDGLTAEEAVLSLPYDVAADGSGNVYIADSNNHRIRRIDADGTITTVAGTGTGGFSGDGGPATAAQLDFPTGVAVDEAPAISTSPMFSIAASAGSTPTGRSPRCWEGGAPAPAGRAY